MRKRKKLKHRHHRTQCHGAGGAGSSQTCRSAFIRHGARRWEASGVWKPGGQAARAPMLSGHMPGGAHGILSLLTVVFVLPEGKY